MPAICLCHLQVGGQRLQADLWWNLDGKHAQVALRLLPLLAEELAPLSTRCAGRPGPS